MYFAALPPEVNSGLMYSGSGAGPMLAAASAWDGLATELHSAAAGYGSVVDSLVSEGWMGPASTSMAAAAAPYAAWMTGTAAQAEQTAAQARAAVAAYETAFAATVPPPVIAANRTQLATLVATNVLGQNTPAIAANEAHYAEMWAQDATAMDGYQTAANARSALTPFTEPKQTTNPNATAQQAAAVANTTGSAAATHAQSAAAATPVSTGVGDILSSPQLGDVRNAVSWATFVPQNSSYMFSIVNALQALARSMMPAAAAAAGANAASALAPATAGLGGLGVLTGALGQSGTIGALSVPQAWAAATPLTGTAHATLASATMSMNPATGNPSMLGGLPMLANALRGGTDAHHGAMPRFDLRPSVIPRSPAAG